MLWKIMSLFCAAVSLCALEPVVVVLGPPGSGKGYAAQFFRENHGYTHLSAGDILRHEIDRRTPIGIQIEEIVSRGERVDAGLMQSLMTKHVCRVQREGKPFIIDGFGGGEQDIAFLHDLLLDLGLIEKTFVLFLDAKDETCKDRMRGRLVCSECEYIYNLETQPPHADGQCDFCSASLIRRSTDTPQVIENRMILYRERVEPNYVKAFAFFPTLFFRTDGNLDGCTRFYQELSDQLPAFEGDAADFVHRLSTQGNDSYKNHFITDRYTAARGMPQMLDLYCRLCGAWVMEYQKDGPGPLLRCYVDRIRNSASQLNFTVKALSTTPLWSCKHCNFSLAQPCIYQKHGEIRPAYQILSDQVNGVALSRIVEAKQN